ncbi:hypothetical protein [Oceanobacillus arenosus]|uniref:hypothetical protein n=1 Tax=Oceanobacillus arenosus TaxID=1229153 RepID=UPI001474F53C|nr:hypothetical protein [Oceanobacillus arenosus]
MKTTLKANKRPALVLIILIFIAGLLDIKYKGLFYKSLPNSIQSYLTDIRK